LPNNTSLLQDPPSHTSPRAPARQSRFVPGTSMARPRLYRKVHSHYGLPLKAPHRRSHPGSRALKIFRYIRAQRRPPLHRWAHAITRRAALPSHCQSVSRTPAERGRRLEPKRTDRTNSSYTSAQAKAPVGRLPPDRPGQRNFIVIPPLVRSPTLPAGLSHSVLR